MKINSIKIRRIKFGYFIVLFLLTKLRFAELSSSQTASTTIGRYHFINSFSAEVYGWTETILFVANGLYEKDLKKFNFIKNPWLHICISLLSIYAFYEMTYPLNDYIYDGIIVHRNIFYYLNYIVWIVYIIINLIEWIYMKIEEK